MKTASSDTSEYSSWCGVCTPASILVLIGGLNWGLVGLGGFLDRNLNVLNLLLGRWPEVEWAVYILIGLAALLRIFGRNCACRRRNPS